MKSFNDSIGRPWLISINVAAVKRTKALLGVDLYGLVADKLAPLGALLGDPVLFVDVLYVLCEPQCKERGLTDEQFGGSLGGDSLQGAADAFVEELIDFFPDPRVRAGLRKVVDLSRKVQAGILEHIEEKTASVDAESIVKKLIESSGSSPESSASTPDPLPSESST